VVYSSPEEEIKIEILACCQDESNQIRTMLGAAAVVIGESAGLGASAGSGLVDD
jgi:hypothetical protein